MINWLVGQDLGHDGSKGHGGEHWEVIKIKRLIMITFKNFFNWKKILLILCI
jgi:hypothetical protein